MRSDDFYRTLVDEAGDAIILSDANGVIQLWNHGAERVFGFSRAEAIGQRLDIIIPKKQRARHWRGYAETIRTGRSKYAAGDTLAVPALRADGRRISIEFTIVLMRQPNGTVTGIAAIIRDVTERFEELRRLRGQRANA